MRFESPGFFDLQVNGFAGVDFNDPLATPEDLHRALDALRRTGVTRCLPTLITSSPERFAQCARNLLALNHPAVAGLHMEGPYISDDDGPRGAHPRKHVCAASREDFLRRQAAAEGRIRLVTLAPEVPGTLAMTEWLAEHGLLVAIGHTAASPEQIRDTVNAGAKLSTHLGNGCAGTLPRHPNLIWEQLAEDKLTASLIVDGHHLPPATVKSFVRAKTPSRTVLVTDAIAAAGCPPGEYVLNGERVVLDAHGRVAPPGKPWLAGSALTMDAAIANLARFTGLSLHQILPLASTQPAALLGEKPVGRVALEWNVRGEKFSTVEVIDA